MPIHSLKQVIQWKSLLIEHYKDLHLTEEAVMVIFVTAHLIESGTQLVTPDALSHVMMLSMSDIDAVMVDLSRKGWVETIENDQGGWETSLDGIQALLIKQFLMTQQQERQEITQGETDNLYDLFEKELGHTLSSLEIDVIRSWLDNGYAVEKIRQALYEAIIHKGRSVHYVDKILLAWSQEEERMKENYTTIDDKWRHDIQKSIEIAKYDWTKKTK